MVLNSSLENNLERSFVIDNNTTEKNVVVYEVNLSIKKEIYEKNKEWLIDHIKDMVNINKFMRVNIYHQLNLDPTDDSFVKVHRLTARYYISSYDHLKSYLEQRAKNMRNQVREKFGDDYTVFRRVFTLEQEILGNA